MPLAIRAETGDGLQVLTGRPYPSGEGAADAPRLVLHLRATDDFCRMLTGRINLPVALISGRLRLHCDLRLFLRMSTLFSVDARP